MQTLKELIDMGFTPAVAAVMVACIVLWATLLTVVISFHRENLRQRAANIVRIEESEKKHAICDTERSKLKRQMSGVQQQLRLLHACPNDDCPIRQIMQDMGHSSK